jgi:hypothetical protein
MNPVAVGALGELLFKTLIQMVIHRAVSLESVGLGCAAALFYRVHQFSNGFF